MNKDLKVAIIHHPIRYWGGAQYHLRELVDAFPGATSDGEDAEAGVVHKLPIKELTLHISAQGGQDAHAVFGHSAGH